MCQQSLSAMDRPFLFTLCFFYLTASCQGQEEAGKENAAKQQPADPFILYGPHGYNTFVHARCQEVPTANISLEEIQGNWNLIQYSTSFDGKPFPPHAPYLCPESRMVFSHKPGDKRMNISQLSFEWPIMFKDVVEWVQHPNRTGVFFHEENIFALWTMKIMEVVPDDRMLFFFCIDYTIWPGWNHRGVYILSRGNKLKAKVRRKLSTAAHRRMRMDYHRTVNTTVCDPEDYWSSSADGSVSVSQEERALDMEAAATTASSGSSSTGSAH